MSRSLVLNPVVQGLMSLETCKHNNMISTVPLPAREKIPKFLQKGLGGGEEEGQYRTLTRKLFKSFLNHSLTKHSREMIFNRTKQQMSPQGWPERSSPCVIHFLTLYVFGIYSLIYIKNKEYYIFVFTLYQAMSPKSFKILESIRKKQN